MGECRSGIWSMLRAQLRMDSRGWGREVLWSRHPHEQKVQRAGSSGGLRTTASPSILDGLNFRGRKGLEIVESNPPNWQMQN